MKKTLCILHLEDDNLAWQLVCFHLERQGIHCESRRVETKGAFIEALEKGGFDLILSDISIPGFDGMSALSIASWMRPEVPYIFVSGHPDEGLAAEALMKGASGYVLKSDVTKLALAVRRATGGSGEPAGDVPGGQNT